MDILNLADYLGIDLNIAVLGILGLIILLVILIIIMLVHTVQMRKLKKRYLQFMDGKEAGSLENLIQERLEKMEREIKVCDENEQNIHELFNTMKYTFQKIGLVKYDAFNEMGGKLSFSLALLNQKNDGFIINAVHSREGCYTYIKEILDGNSVIVLSDEEKEALDMALDSNQ